MMTLDRASASVETYCRWYGWDYLFLRGDIVDGLELAQYYRQATMLILWGGLSVYHNKSRRWLCMGPALLLRHDPNGMGWAHSSSQDMWSITLNGPSVGAR